MKVLASKQANIINSAPNSVASPSFANNPANPSLSVNTAQLTAPVNPNNNSSPQAPTVIYVDADANKSVPPWVRLLGLTLATVGIIVGGVYGIERYRNGKIRNAITSHIEKYTSPDNLHLPNSIEPRWKIYELCQELLKQPDIPPEQKNSINTFLDALKIDPKTGNIRETHLLSKNADHYRDQYIGDLTFAGIEKARLILCEKLFKDVAADENKALALSLTKRNIELLMEKLIDNHDDQSIPDYKRANNDYLILDVSVNRNPNGEIEVLNPVDNEPFSEKTNFSNHRFTSLIPQATTTPYYGNSLLDGFVIAELLGLAFRR